MTTESPAGKRIIVCCDGTWMDADNGYSKPSIFPYHPNAVLQIPSNVTRIARAFKRYGRDGKHQIIYYHSGVGTGGASFLDSITGGFLGTGISENVREAYSFITINYTPGDEIVILGFSRGAFTARSVSGLVRDIGLLTREGMKDFAAIYKDAANRHNQSYHDIFPDVPFKDKPKTQEEYRERLVASKLTRVNDPNGERIHVQAVGVWDTVGSLGIPNLTILSKMGLPHSTKEFKFYDTALYPTIKHAFQALALDEHRNPFSPAVWERPAGTEGTDLRQVWFPGSHAGVGGGYEDQEVANVSLAWMMDQLSSIGVTFKDDYIDLIYNESKAYYKSLPATCSNSYFSACLWNRQPQPWVTSSIYDRCHPVRPFGLGKIYESETGIWLLAGKKIRTPGLYMRMDPDTGSPTKIPLRQTNERIHSSVRLRLRLQGLSPDDKYTYQASALLANKYWKLEKKKINVFDPVGPDAGLKWGRYDGDGSSEDHDGFDGGHGGIIGGGNGQGQDEDGDRTNVHDSVGNEEEKKKRGGGIWKRAAFGGDGAGDRVENGGGGGSDGTAERAGDGQRGDEEESRWAWVWVGPEAEAPKERVLIEENLGPYERRLLALDESEEVSNLVFG